MPSLSESQIMPKPLNVLRRQPALGLPDRREMIPDTFDLRLPFLNDPERRFRIENVPQAPVKRCVSFSLSRRKHFGCRRDLIRVVHILGFHAATGPLEERFNHEPFNNLRGDRDGLRARGRVLSQTSLTSVVQSSTVPLVRFHRIPAGGAPENAGQKPGRLAGPGRGHTPGFVCRLERRPVDQGLMSVQVRNVGATVYFPEICSVADQVPNRSDRPRTGGALGKPVCDLRPRLSGGSPVESLLDKRRFRAWPEPSGVVFDIAERDGATDVHAPVHGVGAGHKPRFALAVNLELCDGGHDRRDHSSCPSGGIDSFRNGEQGRVVGGESVEEFPEMCHGPAEPVEFRHDDPFTGPGFDSVYGLVKSGSVSFLAGLVKVFVNFVDMLAVKFRPAFDGSALFGGRYEPFAFSAGDAGYAHIAVYGHLVNRVGHDPRSEGLRGFLGFGNVGEVSSCVLLSFNDDANPPTISVSSPLDPSDSALAVAAPNVLVVLEAARNNAEIPSAVVQLVSVDVVNLKPVSLFESHDPTMHDFNASNFFSVLIPHVDLPHGVATASEVPAFGVKCLKVGVIDRYPGGYAPIFSLQIYVFHWVHSVAESADSHAALAYSAQVSFICKTRTVFSRCKRVFAPNQRGLCLPSYRKETRLKRDQLVRDDQGRVWEVHRPKGGGVLLRGGGGIRWVSVIELDRMVPARGFEDLRWDRSWLRRTDADRASKVGG